MPSPSRSITFWDVPYGTTTVISVGNVVLPTTDETGYLVATSANRAGRRSEGIAVTAFGGSGTGTVEIWMNGTMPASYTPSLGAGSASWVRPNDTTGNPERFTPSPGGTSDVIGKVSASGRLTLMFQLHTEDSAIASGSGTATPGGTTGNLQFNNTTFAGDAYWNLSAGTPGRLRANYFDPVDGVTLRSNIQVGIDPATDHYPLFGFIRFARELCNPGSISLITFDDGVTGRAAMGVSGGDLFFGDTGLTVDTLVYGSTLELTAGGTTTAGGFEISQVSLGSLTGGTGVLSLSSAKKIRRSLGTALQVLRVNAGGTDIEWAAAATSSPGGSNTQFQWNNSSAFAGSSGLVYDNANSQPQAPNGYVITAAGQRMILAGTPTATRTITFPDATDTVELLTTAQTPTNKTINVSNNTLTDTSIAQYDILMANATPKFVRLAKGSNSTVLQTTSGGVVQYGTVTVAMGGTGVTSLPGSSTELLYNNGGALGATTNVKFPASGSLSLGGTVASTGNIRLANTNSIVYRNAGNTADQYMCQLDASNLLWIGSDSAATTSTMVSVTRLFGTASIDFGINGSFVGSWISSELQVNTPIRCGGTFSGYSTLSNPFRFKKAAITQSSTADTTLTSAQYECPYLLVSGTPGGNFNVIGPNTADTVFLVSNTTANTMTLKKSGGTGITIATGITKLCVHDGTDYRST